MMKKDICGSVTDDPFIPLEEGKEAKMVQGFLQQFNLPVFKMHLRMF